MEACDLLLIVGADFPYKDFYPANAKIVQIEPNPVRMGRRAPVAAPLRGQAKPALEDLLPRVKEKEDDSFYRDMQQQKADENEDMSSAERSDSVPIKPQRVMRELSSVASDKAIFLADTGTSTAWTARHLPIGAKQRYSLSSALGSMAFALPAAIGAQFAYPDLQVIAVAGDGAFAMLMADFVTAVKYKLPITCLILNNSKLGFIALEQEAKGLSQHSIDLLNPDFVKFAEACGGVGFRVDKPQQLAAVINQALACPHPAIVDIIVYPDELILPPRVSVKQAFNFGLAKVREVF